LSNLLKLSVDKAGTYLVNKDSPEYEVTLVNES